MKRESDKWQGWKKRFVQGKPQMPTDLTPGTMTTLGQLRPGDAGEFIEFDGRFIVTGFGESPWVQIEYAVDVQRSERASGLIVRHLGRGRIEPARIVMEGEDRVAELEAQVRQLREACREADVLLTSFAVARNFSEYQKDAAVKVLAEIVAALAATAPKDTK